MPPKRKAPLPSGVVGGMKRARTEFPCSLCTSDSPEGLITTNIIQNKTLKNFTGHLQCIDLVGELDWVNMAGEGNLVIKNTKGYKDRLQLQCQVCKEPHGAKLQCTSGKCVRAFHINCAKGADKVKFELKPNCGMPFILNCEQHRGRTSLSQNEGLSSEAILRLQPWDTVVVPFKGKRCEMLVVCVDKEGKKVTVANPIRRESGMPIPPGKKYICDWKAVTVDDRLKSHIPNPVPNGAKDNEDADTSMLGMPTPPSSHSPEVQREVITIPDSPQSIVDLVTPSPGPDEYSDKDEDMIQLDSIITPPISPAVTPKRPKKRPFILETVPGLLEAVVDRLFEDPWDKRLNDLMGPNH